MKSALATGIRIIVGLGFIFSLIGGSISGVEAAAPTELFFSEYVEGSSYNKAWRSTTAQAQISTLRLADIASSSIPMGIQPLQPPYH